MTTQVRAAGLSLGDELSWNVKWQAAALVCFAIVLARFLPMCIRSYTLIVNTREFLNRYSEPVLVDAGSYKQLGELEDFYLGQVSHKTIYTLSGHP